MDWLRRFLGLQPVEESTEETPKSAPVSVPTPKASVDDDAETLKTRKPEPIEISVGMDDDTDEAPLVSPDGRTRQLPPLESVAQPKAGIQFNYGQLSDVGQVRDNNQDSILCFASSMNVGEAEPNFGLFIVADGMGGHEHGERASAVATKIITKHVTDNIYMPLLNGEGGDAERPTIIEVLRLAVQEANSMVAEQVPDGGTTVTAAALMGQAAYIAHVGDSRAYIITEDLVEQVTRDHSLVQRLIELDQLSPEDAAEHPQRNVLYRAIGQSDNLDVDAIIRQVPPKGYLLICSDGLWNLIGKDELKEIVLGNGDDTQASCQQLVELANERGGSDNISVVLVRVPG